MTRGASPFVLPLTPYEGGAGTFKRMGPWFATMAFVMTFGVLVGDRFIDTTGGQAFTFAVPIVAVAYGVYRMMTRPPPAQHRLEMSEHALVITSSDGATPFRGDLRALAIEKSAYTMHTKYGSHTFPVLDLRAGEQHVRLCVWDNRPEFAFVGIKAGKKPHYLIATAQWPEALSRLTA